MALEQYKTQVLLLHSQQSTLDALGAGFNDRYSVHFATSGSEALTTLGETPIHIIVSAQDLPGMSGLEALREAKKRSPDTIGILLADDETDGNLEALVGEKEVFQIVRGEVEPGALLKIVENAARRMRMLTLSQSANDNAANVDEPVDSSEGEHIVMETAENGSFIISDGTGRMPALKPEKIGINVETGGRNVDVLVLTKDSEFLDTIRESARGMHTVHHAVTAQQAQDAARDNPVGVLVTDAAIAGSKVEMLTQKLRSVAPRLVAIVAGRRDDGDMLMDLINRGQVYRFLLKPVSPGRARLAVEASVKHHLEAKDAAAKGAPAAPSAPAAPRAVAPAETPAKAGASPAAAEHTPQPVPAAAKPAPPAPGPIPAAAPELTTERAPEPGIEAVALADKRTEPTLEPAPMDNLDVAGLTDTGSMRATARLMAEQAASKQKNGLPLPLIGAGVVAALLIGGGVWYMAGSGPADTPAVVAERPAEAMADETAAVATTEPPAETPVPAAEPEPAPAYVALLDNARFARDSGRILAPAGDNAIEWYVAARDAAPANTAITEELAALVDQLIGMAETALLEERAADAENALQMAAVASPGNPRLNFLNAQLDQLQLRGLLDGARAAVRESRFEDAARLLARAETVAGTNVEPINQVAEELATARSAQQAEDVIAEANARLAAGNLTAPSNDNARYFFELALTGDPDNVAAQQGLLVVASRLVLQARDAIDSGNLAEATGLLDEARALDPGSSELAASDAALDVARERQAEAERQAAVARQAAALAAAERRAAEQRRAAANSATLSTGGAATDEIAADDNPLAADAASLADDNADDGLGAALPVPAAQAAGPDGRAQPETAQRQSSTVEPIAVSQLTRVNYVAPKYPRIAQRRGTSGWVDVSFIVLPSGTVGDVAVIESTPGTVFDDAAREAVSQWRFEPVIENGTAVTKSVAVRMSFSLQ